MDLIDKEDVAGLKIGQHGRKITRSLEHRTRGYVNLCIHLVGDNVGQCGLSQARWSEDEDVVEALTAVAGRAHEDIEVGHEPSLANKLLEPARPEGLFETLLARIDVGS